MKKIILFGTELYGQSAYYKMKSQFEIVYFVQDNPISDKKELFGIPIISSTQLKEIYTSGTDIIVCKKNYFQVSTQLIEMGITDYYVMMEGFLYHNSTNETMVPVELNKYSYFRKERDEKNILYVQNATICKVIQKTAAMMRKQGYKVYLLYTMLPLESCNGNFASIYNGIYTFYTADGIIDFIENSDFDIIHSSDASDILANIVLGSSKHVVYDTHDTRSQQGCGAVENLILKYIATTQSDGNIYSSRDIAEIAGKKYGLEGKEILLSSTEHQKSYSQELAAFYERVKKRKVIR